MGARKKMDHKIISWNIQGMNDLHKKVIIKKIGRIK